MHIYYHQHPGNLRYISTIEQIDISEYFSISDIVKALIKQHSQVNISTIQQIRYYNYEFESWEQVSLDCIYICPIDKELKISIKLKIVNEPKSNLLIKPICQFSGKADNYVVTLLNEGNEIFKFFLVGR